jgi:short-subunit dehydrogenase
MNLRDKRIVVTGAASGIGLALVRRLIKYGGQILAADLNPIDAGQFPASTNISTFVGDLSDALTVDRLFEVARAEMGGIDLFIANAGYAYYEQTSSPDWGHIEAIFRLNVFSPLYSIEKMRALMGDQPYTVAITASTMAHMAMPGYAYYGATKAALHRFAEGYRFEMPPNARLMLIYPIATRTAFFGGEKNPAPVPFPSQTADYVAGRILAGLRRDARSVQPSAVFMGFRVVSAILPVLRKLYQRQADQRLQNWLRARNER